MSSDPSSTSHAPEFVLLSRDRAERYEPQGTEICISITDPGAPDVALADAFADVLRLEFHDIAAAGTRGEVLFSPEHAQRIREFVGAWPQATRIVVHCTGGASRSPGVALGLCDLHAWPATALERAKPFWNSHVRAVLAASSRPDSRPAG